MKDIEERLTIAEIKECKNNLSWETKECKKASSICFQAGTFSAIMSGLSFLIGLIGFAYIPTMDKDVISIWIRMIGYIAATVFLSIGCFSTEIAREAFLSSEEGMRYVHMMEDIALLKKEQEKFSK